MLQQTYAAALWYLSYILPVRHTDNSSSETVLDNESSAITESFGNESKHARSSETAKDCSATVSKNSVSGSVITARSASDSVIAERSKDSARGSVIAQRSAGDSVSAITHGYGTYTWPDGRRYIGAWYDCKQHGHGTFTGDSGGAFTGVWFAGKFTGTV